MLDPRVAVLDIVAVHKADRSQHVRRQSVVRIEAAHFRAEFHPRQLLARTRSAGPESTLRFTHIK